jgi:mannosyltransferase
MTPVASRNLGAGEAMSPAPPAQRDGKEAQREPGGQPASPGADAAAEGRTRERTASVATYVPAAVAAAVMTVLGLWGLARGQAMGNDEVATYWAARLSLRQLAHLLSSVDAVHGTYYLLMHGWMAVGSSPTVIRIPSLIAMIAAAAMVVIIARRLTGSAWAGLFAGLIMALTPVISVYAQTARSYAMVYLCVLGSTLALLHALEAESRHVTGARLVRWWLAYGALVTLGGYLNELSLLVLAAHAVTVLLARYGWRTAAHWAAAGVCGAAAIVPLMLLSQREDGQVGWIPRPDVRSVEILFRDYFGPTTWVSLVLLACAVVAAAPARRRWRRWLGGSAADSAAGAGAAPESAWWSRAGVSLPSVAVSLLIMPGSLLILESLVTRPLYVDRYVLYGEAGAALLAGAGAARIGRWLGDAAGRRALAWAPGVLVCLCGLLFQLGAQHNVRTPGSREFNYGGPAFYVGAHADRGDGVLFFNSFFRKARLGYPREFEKVTDFAMAESPAQAGNFNGTDKPFAVTRPLMLGYRRIWVIGRSPYAALRSPPIRAEAMVLRRGFSIVYLHHFRGMTVTLWLRR